MSHDVPRPLPLPRRDFLKSTACAAAALAGYGLHRRPVAAADTTDPYGGFKMSIQSFSLRSYDTPTALRHTRDLGLKYWEAYSKHIPLGTLPAHVAEQRAQLDSAGITLLAYGVVSINTNETQAREIFDFARAMNLVSLSANPEKDPKVFDLLDRLVAEYEIPIAIHNHGPRATYDKIADVEQWTKDRHPLIGACVDTGHFLRSDENPVEAIERLGSRVFGVHLKDARGIRDEAELDRLVQELPRNRAERLKEERKVMTILGEGDLDVPGVLRALRKLNYDRALSLEYEENADNPLSDIEVCLSKVRDAVKTL
jgi:sugar phosphate isomerase/epimerase